MLSPMEGCRTPLYLALSPYLKPKSGEYWANCITHPLPQMHRLAMAQYSKDNIWRKLLDYCYLQHSKVENILESIRSNEVEN